MRVSPCIRCGKDLSYWNDGRDDTRDCLTPVCTECCTPEEQPVEDYDDVDDVSNYGKVWKFHEVFDLPNMYGNPAYPEQSVVELRKRLITEEYNELMEAIDKADPNINHIAKELADLLYVVYGTGIAYGIDMDSAFDAVHVSNMSKLTADGKVLRREDGKILKSDQYKEPDMSCIYWLECDDPRLSEAISRDV